jgi:hypothetical protein
VVALVGNRFQHHMLVQMRTGVLIGDYFHQCVGRLVCVWCSSGRSFAYSFLRAPPRGDALAVRLPV